MVSGQCEFQPELAHKASTQIEKGDVTRPPLTTTALLEPLTPLAQEEPLASRWAHSIDKSASFLFVNAWNQTVSTPFRHSATGFRGSARLPCVAVDGSLSLPYGDSTA